MKNSLPCSMLRSFDIHRIYRFFSFCISGNTAKQLHWCGWARKKLTNTIFKFWQFLQCLKNTSFWHKFFINLNFYKNESVNWTDFAHNFQNMSLFKFLTVVFKRRVKFKRRSLFFTRTAMLEIVLSSASSLSCSRTNFVFEFYTSFLVNFAWIS